MLATFSSFHMTTYFLWGIIAAVDSNMQHSGYEFPWNPMQLIPFVSDATHHHFHHKANVGNYGVFFTVWDHLFDTVTEYYEKYPADTLPEHAALAKKKRE